RLDRYLIADDCELTDETGNLTLVHHFREPLDGAAAGRIAVTGYDVWLETTDVPFKPENEIKRDEWNVLGLRSALPLAGKEITGSEFPAELRIDDWAVDFQKGCYLGQEVISRIKSVGRVKRQICLINAQHSFTQDSTLRNEEGEEFTATRDSKKISAGCHLAIAWRKVAGGKMQLIDAQEVV
ncbi:MAG: tRNA-modifying protein YgfZ, partial [Verrucomicrobiales bacterium]|nr:tRNA-modifying protein YgfZ [Verrucomicrobiales bacterium]